MRSRYACALNGVGLGEVDPAILICDIGESLPEEHISAVENAWYDGLRVTRRTRQKLTVTVTFEVHEYDPARRKAVAEKAREWARDGWLTLSDRPGQRLYVLCTQLPAVPSTLKWTDQLKIGFTAYALPYWQEQYPASAAFSGQSGKCILTPSGNRDCFLEAGFTAQAGTVNSLKIAVNGGQWAFQNLGLQQGETMEIGYEDMNHRQDFRIGGRSALNRRTGDSADDLLLKPRTANEISVTADGSVAAKFYGRGLWK